MAKKTELEVLVPREQKITIESIGEVTVRRFKLREISQAGDIIAKLSACFDFNQLLKGEALPVDIPRTLFVLGENDMDIVFRLFSLATGEKQDLFLELEVAETIELLKQVWEIALKPVFEESAKTFKKNSSPLNSTGQM